MADGFTIAGGDEIARPFAAAAQCLLQRTFALDTNTLLAGSAPWELRDGMVDSLQADSAPLNPQKHRSGIFHKLLGHHSMHIAITCGLVLAMLYYFLIGRTQRGGQHTGKKGPGSTFHVLMTCISGFLRGYGLYVIGPFLTPVQRSLQLCFPCIGGETDLALAACTCPMKEFAVSSVALGAIFGGLAGGLMADALGRRITIMISDVLFIVSSLMIGMSGHGSWAWLFFVGRVLAGIAVGVSGPASHAYICELVSPRSRGQLLTLIELSLIAGVFAVFGSSAFLGDDRWRSAIMFSAMPAAMQLVCTALFLHESPRWLVGAGRIEEAEQVVEALGLESTCLEFMAPSSGCSQDQEQNNQKLACKKMPAALAAALAPAIDKRPRSGVATLMRHRRRVMLAIGCALAHNALGANIVMYYSRDILMLASISNSVGSQMSLGAAKALGTLTAFLCVDRCGRRFLLVVGVAGAVVGHLGLAVAFLPGSVDFSATLAWFSLLLFLAAWDLGWASLMSVVISEILPDDVRGLGLGASCSIFWAVSFVQAQTMESLFKLITIAGTFAMYCVASIIGLLFVLVYVPETCGRPLEVE